MGRFETYSLKNEQIFFWQFCFIFLEFDKTVGVFFV